MARVTVEDCVDKISNRFELVALASVRAMDLASGAECTVEKDNDKEAVLALREVACNNVSPDGLKQALLNNFRTRQPVDNEEEEQEEIAASETEEENFEYLSDGSAYAISEDSDNIDEELDDSISFAEDVDPDK